jgi:hypothetical protein
MDKAARSQIDGITPEHCRSFGRLHRLTLEDHPGAAVVFSYQIPASKVGSRLCLGRMEARPVDLQPAAGRDVGFTSRHPRAQDQQADHLATAPGRGRHPR